MTHYNFHLFNKSLYSGKTDNNFETASSNEQYKVPPAALKCPPPSKCFLAKSLTEKSPFERNENLIQPSRSVIKTDILTVDIDNG